MILLLVIALVPLCGSHPLEEMQFPMSRMALEMDGSPQAHWKYDSQPYQGFYKQEYPHIHRRRSINRIPRLLQQSDLQLQDPQVQERYHHHGEGKGGPWLPFDIGRVPPAVGMTPEKSTRKPKWDPKLSQAVHPVGGYGLEGMGNPPRSPMWEGNQTPPVWDGGHEKPSAWDGADGSPLDDSGKPKMSSGPIKQSGWEQSGFDTGGGYDTKLGKVGKILIKEQQVMFQFNGRKGNDELSLNCGSNPSWKPDDSLAIIHMIQDNNPATNFRAHLSGESHQPLAKSPPLSQDQNSHKQGVKPPVASPHNLDQRLFEANQVIARGKDSNNQPNPVVPGPVEKTKSLPNVSSNISHQLFETEQLKSKENSNSQVDQGSNPMLHLKEAAKASLSADEQQPTQVVAPSETIGMVANRPKSQNKLKSVVTLKKIQNKGSQ